MPVVAVVDAAGRLVGGLRWEDLVSETEHATEDATTTSTGASSTGATSATAGT